jgi:hypothetical protein
MLSKCKPKLFAFLLMLLSYADLIMCILTLSILTMFFLPTVYLEKVIFVYDNLNVL